MMEFFELIGEVFEVTGRAAWPLFWLWVACLLWAAVSAAVDHGQASSSDRPGLNPPGQDISLGGNIALAIFFLLIVAVPIWAISWLALGLFDLDRPHEHVFEFFILLLAPLIGLIVVNAAYQGAMWQWPIRKGLQVLVPVLAVAAFIPTVQAGVYWWAISGLSETYRTFQTHDFEKLKFYPASAEDAALTYLELWPSGRHRTQAVAILDELLWHSIDLDERAAAGRTGRRGLESLAAYVETYPDGRHAKDIASKIDLRAIRDIRRYLTKPVSEVFDRSVEEKIWGLADRQGNRSGYATYSRAFPDGAFFAESQRRIEDLDWQKTIDENTMDAFLAFKSEHPDSDRAPLLDERIDDLRWQQADGANTIRSLLEFQSAYPQSVHVGKIEERIAALKNDNAVWEAVRRSATTDAIRQFRTDFPGHKNQADAIALENGVEFRTLLAEEKIAMDFNGCGIQAVCGYIRNLTDTPLRVVIPAGALFVSSNQNAQSMSVVKSSTRFVEGNAAIAVDLPAACADIARDIPYDSVSFSYLPPGEATALTAIRNALDSDKATWHVKQAMVWIVRDNAGSRSIKRRLQGAPISTDDVNKALDLLKSVGYPVETRQARRERP